MKVTSEGTAPWIGKTATCTSCGFTATLEKGDEVHAKAERGQYFTQCPTCNQNIYIRVAV